MGLWWAEAGLMAAWWLMWGGFGEAALAQWGIGRIPALVGLATLWAAGWVHVLPGPGWGSVDLGLVVLSVLGAGLTVLSGRKNWTVAWVVLGALAAAIRSFAPINPAHQTFVPWLGGEAAALGLLAGAVAADPVGAGAVAAAAGGLSSLLRMWLHPNPGALASPDWLYSVLAVLVAWTTAWVVRLPRPAAPA